MEANVSKFAPPPLCENGRKHEYSRTAMARIPLRLTMKICSRQGKFDLVSVYHSATTEGKVEICFQFSLT